MFVPTLTIQHQITQCSTELTKSTSSILNLELQNEQLKLPLSTESFHVYINLCSINFNTHINFLRRILLYDLNC